MAYLDISENSPNMCSRSVIEWGESGPFTIGLKPDDESAEKLYVVQSQIVRAEYDMCEGERPRTVCDRGLTLPFFYFEPKVLHDVIVERGYCTDLDKNNFYQNLVDNTCRLLLSHVNEDIAVEGVDFEGQVNKESIYLRFGRSANLAHLVNRAQSLLDYTLTGLKKPGLTTDQLASTAADPKFGRSFIVPKHRILITSDSPSYLPQIEMPRELHFDQVVVSDPDSKWRGNRSWYHKQEETEIID